MSFPLSNAARSAAAFWLAAIWLAALAGCKAPVGNDAEVDSLLRTVSYDTSVPSTAEERSEPTIDRIDPEPPAKTKFSVGQQARSVGLAVGDGLRSAARLTSIGFSKMVQAAFRRDDDDDIDISSRRGRADRNLNRWLENRERWRRGE